MTDVINMLLEVKEILQQTDLLLDENRSKEAFDLFVQKVPRIQEYLLFLANGSFLPIETINQMSNLLVQAMEQRDSVLLKDVVKYALLDVAEQLLEGCQEE